MTFAVTFTLIDMKYLYWQKGLPGSRLHHGSAVCRFSWNSEEILHPNSQRKSTADSMTGPSVSTAIGWNENEGVKSLRVSDILSGSCSILLSLSINYYYSYYYLTIVGQASSIQRPSEANLTPACVGGGRHVINWSRLWFSSSRNL